MKRELFDTNRINTSYTRTINKDLIPTCNILGVDIAAIDMKWLLDYLHDNLRSVSGDYICVSNVHTTVMSYKDKSYQAVQNNALMAIPDGGPLSSLARRRGYRSAQRTTGPSLMGEIFKTSFDNGYRHFFYGSTQQTLDDLKEKLEENYPGITIAGMYSPPFRELSEEEDEAVIKLINDANPDFIWVGLGAPKQEIWMAQHQGKVKGLMIGVGAGFDYYAGNIHRAPAWMQDLNLEWFYRLMQDPKRLIKRYTTTNISFIWDAVILRKRRRDRDSAHNKQTVLLVHNYYQTPGGEDTVVANEKKLLEDHGHKVYLYTRRNSELDDMSALKIARKTIFNYQTYKEIRNLIREKHIDIVHVHNTLSLVSPSVYYAARSRRVPVVKTVHNFRLLCPNALFYRDGHICEECLKYGPKRAVKYACYRDNVFYTYVAALNLRIHRATGILKKVNFICLTEFNKKKLLSLKQIRPEKVFVKPNFSGALAENANIATSNNVAIEPQFIYVGRLDEYKGVRVLLKAWKGYESQGGTDKLIICGTGEQESWIKAYIKANALKNVDMKGFVPNKETLSMIASSKALILPTQLYEGFPMTIVEAYSVGTPVIASAIGNAGSLVSDGVTGWTFKHTSPEALSTAIRKAQGALIDREVIRREYENNYSREKNYQMLKSIYDSVGKKHG